MQISLAFFRFLQMIFYFYIEGLRDESDFSIVPVIITVTIGHEHIDQNRDYTPPTCDKKML